MDRQTLDALALTVRSIPGIESIESVSVNRGPLMTWPEILRTHIGECSACQRDKLNLCEIGHIMRMFAGAAQDEQLFAAYAEVSR